MSSREISEWMEFFKVREERRKDAERDRQMGLGDDDEVTYWGNPAE